MSVYFTVDERFEIPAVTEAHDEFLEILASHCVALAGDCTVPDGTTFLKLELVADGQVFHLDRDSTLAQCAEAFSAFADVKQFSLNIRYEYRWSAWRDSSNVGFDKWLKYISEADDAFLSTVYCACWNSADCGDTDEPGELTAYGVKNGKMYHGEVPFVPVETVPDGCWVHPQAAAIFESDENEPIAPTQIQELIPYFHRLEKLSQLDHLSVDKTSFEYAMNNIALHNHAEVTEYADCISALSNLLGYDYFSGVNKLYDEEYPLRILNLVTEGTKVVGFELAQA